MSIDTHQTDHLSDVTSFVVDALRPLDDKDRELAELRETNAGLNDEVQRLRAQVAALESDSVVTITPAIRAALDLLKHPRPDCCQSDQHYAERIMGLWAMREAYKHRVDEAFKKNPHAGMEYIANDLEWDKVVTRWGRAEAAELVEQLTYARGEPEVRAVVEGWEAE